MQKRNKDRDGLYQRTGSPYYWASFVDPRGRRIRRSTGIAVSREGRKEAEALLAKWRLQAHREKQWGEKPRPTFDELMALYLTTVTPHKRDPERDRNSAKRLYPVFTGSLLDEITGPMISQYVNERREVVAAATVNKEIGLLSRGDQLGKQGPGLGSHQPSVRQAPETAGGSYALADGGRSEGLD